MKCNENNLLRALTVDKLIISMRIAPTHDQPLGRGRNNIICGQDGGEGGVDPVEGREE